MSGRNCLGCHKALPADYSGELCSLCSMGFAPAPRVEREPEHQKSGAVSMADESGLRCQRCASSLTFKDVSLGICRVCGAEVHAGAAPAGIRPNSAEQDSGYFIMPRNSRLGEVAWPEDAPLW